MNQPKPTTKTKMITYITISRRWTARRIPRRWKPRSRKPARFAKATRSPGPRSTSSSRSARRSCRPMSAPPEIISEEWLKAAGFKWHQLERQPDQHWLLWLGRALKQRPSLTDTEDLGMNLRQAFADRTRSRIGSAGSVATSRAAITALSTFVTWSTSTS